MQALWGGYGGVFSFFFEGVKEVELAGVLLAGRLLGGLGGSWRQGFLGFLGILGILGFLGVIGGLGVI
jgi:hypothetical protein